MRLYVDLETLQLIEGPGFRNPVTSLRFKRGDAARLDVTFLANGTTPASIGDPGSLELRFGAKPRGRYDVGYLVQASDWTLPEVDAENPLYQCSPSFNTVELDAAMQVGSPTGSELSEIALMGEITWREGAGEPTSTRTFLVIVENDVNRGTEGVPTDADPPYPAPELLLLLSNTDWLTSKAVRYDAAQTPLDQVARDQFFANFGATLAEELAGPAVRAVQLLDATDSAWLTYDPVSGEALLSAGLLAGNHFSGAALFDTSQAEAVNLDNRELLDIGGSPVLEWGGGYGYFFSDLAVPSGFFGDMLYEIGSGSISVDLTNRQLLDGTGNPALEWGGSEFYMYKDVVLGPYSSIAEVFACYNGGSYLYGITDTIDLTTATSITVSGGIITGYA